jgi:hypothetical protein
VARLVMIMRRDPSSAITAALEGWEHPVSREALILMDLFDLEAVINSGTRKPKPHNGRPWKVVAETKQCGNAGGRTPEQVKAMLREQFGQPEAPV